MATLLLSAVSSDSRRAATRDAPSRGVEADGASEALAWTLQPHDSRHVSSTSRSATSSTTSPSSMRIIVSIAWAGSRFMGWRTVVSDGWRSAR